MVAISCSWPARSKPWKISKQRSFSLRVDERCRVLVRRDGLGEELPHVGVDALEDLVEVRGELGDELRAALRARAGRHRLSTRWATSFSM